MTQQEAEALVQATSVKLPDYNLTVGKYTDPTINETRYAVILTPKGAQVYDVFTSKQAPIGFTHTRPITSDELVKKVELAIDILSIRI